MRAHAFLLAVVVGCGVDDGVRTIEQASTQQCPTNVVEGIDVYQGQGTVDWAMVKASGRDFAFVKATQGNYNKQSTFAANWANTAANGLVRSAYHFFDPTIDGVAQAQWFLDELTAAGGMGSADLPPLLDIECPLSSDQATSESGSPNCEYTGNSGWVATATMQQRIFDWLNTVELATARKPIIYSYPSWFGDVMFTDARLTAYPLFIATYGSCASVPAPWQSAVFWQYSASGTVSGISGNVDEDRFFGSDLAGWNATTIEVDAGVGGDGGPGSDGGFQDQGDAGTMKGSAGGCGCHSEGGGASSAVVFGFVIIAVRVRRRRRSS